MDQKKKKNISVIFAWSKQCFWKSHHPCSLTLLPLHYMHVNRPKYM